MGLDFVCASPIAHQSGFVRGIRRSFASGCGSIRTLRGVIAQYHFGGDGRLGERTCSLPLQQNFYSGMGLDFVYASPIDYQSGFVRGIRRSFASGCGSIRTLRGVIAQYHFGGDGRLGERTCSLPLQQNFYSGMGLDFVGAGSLITNVGCSVSSYSTAAAPLAQAVMIWHRAFFRTSPAAYTSGNAVFPVLSVSI